MSIAWKTCSSTTNFSIYLYLNTTNIGPNKNVGEQSRIVFVYFLVTLTVRSGESASKKYMNMKRTGEIINIIF